MAKRAIADIDGDATDHSSSKRIKATATTPDITTSRPEATFLGFPLELREEIYRNVCGAVPDVQDRPKHPFDKFPSNLDVTESAALLLLNRQTRFEVQTLFNREYAGLIFYFEDIPALFDVHAELIRRRCLWEARFVLRTRNGMHWSDHARYMKLELPHLLHSQTGYKKLYQEEGGDGTSLPLHIWIPFGIVFRSWNEHQENLVLESRYRDFCDTNGVVIEVGRHESCFTDNGKCRQYFEARYPDLPNSLRLKEFAWKPHPHDGYKVKIEGGLILEGKVHDLNMNDYNIRRGRFRLAASRGDYDQEARDRLELPNA